MKVSGVHSTVIYSRAGVPFEPTANDKLLWAIYGAPADITTETKKDVRVIGEIKTRAHWLQLWATIPSYDFSEIHLTF